MIDSKELEYLLHSELMAFSVGEVHPLKEYLQKGGGEGHVLNIGQSGVILNTMYAKPNQREVDNYSAGADKKFGLYEYKDVFFLLGKFGIENWFACPYNHSLVHEDERIVMSQDNEKKSRFAIKIILTDTTTWKIVALNFISISPRLTTRIISNLEKQVAKPIDKANYHSQIDEVWKMNNNDNILGEKAICVCKGGSDINMV